MKSYRFVILVDVETCDDLTLADAYRALRARMHANDWESTDEAYSPDGEEIDPDTLQAARMEVLANERE